MGQNKLILNGRFKQFDPRKPGRAELIHGAILIANGKIIGVGDPNKLPSETISNLTRIDAKGALIVPGFVDSHNHFTAMGMQEFELDLGGLRTRREIMNALSIENALSGHKKPLIAFNYEYDLTPESERLTAADLERIAPNRVIQVTDRTGHMSVTTRRTLQLAGIKLRSTDCFDCELRCDAVTEKFNGELCGEANLKLHRYMSSGYRSSSAFRKMSWKQAAELALSKGVTSVHALIDETELDELAAYQDCLPIDLRLYTQTHNVRKVKEAGLRQIGGCGAVLLDGDTGPHTAAMIEPYADQPNTNGTLNYSDEELEAFMTEAHAENIQISLHCVGDRASDQFLRVIEKVIRKQPDKKLRHRIEHFSFGTADQIQRANQLGVCVSAQPGFNHYWPHETYTELLGEERAHRVDPIASVMNGGVPVALGSDCTVTPCDPLLAIHAAVNHSLEQERISADNALYAHTRGGAFLARNERTHGAIEAGYAADLAFLEADPAEVEPSQIKEIPVLRTIYRGETVFERS